MIVIDKCLSIASCGTRAKLTKTLENLSLIHRLNRTSNDECYLVKGTLHQSFVGIDAILVKPGDCQGVLHDYDEILRLRVS